MKECPWAEHLTSLPNRGVGALSSVPHLTLPMSCLHALKAIIGQTIMYNGTTTDFEVKS